MERKNRPTNVNLDGTGNGIGLNAIQTLCLVRNTPLIFGDLFINNSAHWTKCTVCATVKEMHPDHKVAEVYDRAKALCETQ